ncbi:MAG: M48 family metalloprotease [Candidatus Methanomethylicaceae archaeon]
MTGNGNAKVRYSIDEIIALFDEKGGGRLSFSKEYGRILFNALSKLPRDVAEWAVEKLVFLSSLADYSAYAINLEELTGRGKTGIVVLCDDLRHQPEDLQSFVIAHEIAHAKLKHSTAFQDLRSVNECELRDEEAADRLANSWLSHK